MTEKKFTFEEIKLIKKAQKPIIGIGMMLSLLISILSISYYVSNDFNDIIHLLPLILIIFIIFGVSFINRKYSQDLNYGNKIVSEEKILKKIIHKYYPPSMNIDEDIIKEKTNNYREKDVFKIQVNNHLHKVDEDFYHSCEEGDDLLFYTTKFSNALLKIEL